MSSNHEQFGRCVAIAALVMVGRFNALAQSPSVPSTQPAQVANPHWSKTDCQVCHDRGKPGPISIERAEAICRRCHDGRQSPREVHPVGRLFVKGEIEKPRDWPAPEGRLGCMTCHDVRYACDHPQSRSDANRAFVRKPPADIPGGFCGACHVASVTAKGGRYNPHKMLDDSGQQIRESCLFCHLSSFMPVDRMRTGDAGLRNDGIGMCAGCHPRHIDYFEPGHIGLIVTSDIMQKITIPSRRQDPVSTTQPADIDATVLPLEAGSRIVCATCHNPHPKGVFPLGSELSEGAMTKDSSNPQAFRGPAKDVCHVCHEE